MLIIFDFDGVLVKASWKGLFEAYQAMIKAEGKNYQDFFGNFREFKEWWSPDWRENEIRLGFRNSEEMISRIFYETYGLYNHLFPWVRNVLQELSKQHQLSIFTNRHRSSMVKILGPLIKYFSPAIGAENVKKLKPNPEGINLILDITKTERQSALFIGDRVEDIMAGKSAGIKTGAVKWGLGKWKELLAHKPDYQFRRWKDFLKI